VSATPRGDQACVEDRRGSPSRRSRPVGVVIVIVYWAAMLPPLARWRDELALALQGAVVATSVQIGLRLHYLLKRHVRFHARANLRLRMGEC